VSKKKFTSGLDVLFTDPSNDEFLNDTHDDGGGSVQVAEETAVITKTSKRTKDFTSNFDSFFDDTFERVESFGADYNNESYRNAETKKPFRRPVTGLDALIRQTTGETDYDPQLKKRLTLILESSKIDRLQEIAKAQSIYFKDFLHDLVTNYIREYDRVQKMA
jgi:hypothetical protein